MAQPDGRIGHAEIKIGDSPIMLADEFPGIGARSPQSLGGSPVSILLYVKDVDAMFTQAIAAGATVQRPVADQFYGDRTGGVTDPFGHVWYIATRKEDVSPEEMKKRAAAAGQAQTRASLSHPVKSTKGPISFEAAFKTVPSPDQSGYRVRREKVVVHSES